MSNKEDQKIPVIEIFGPTLQGEGVLIGRQTFFIRFGGCDYKCTKCDSMHAVDGEQIQKNADYMTQDDIVLLIISKMANSACSLITFSGGNPALWELEKVVKGLHELGIVVALETQGTYYKDWIANCGIITISPKGPGMGEKFEPDQFKEYIDHLIGHPGLSIKVVVFDQRDIEFAVSVRELLESWGHKHMPFYLSLGNSYPPGTDLPNGPCLDNAPTDNLRLSLLSQMVILTEEMLQDPRCAKFVFLPQLHVLLWGNKQGV